MSIWQLRLCSFSKDIIPLPAHQLTLELLCKIPAWQEVFQSPIAVQHEFEKLHGHHTWMGSALFWPYTSCLFLWGYIKSKLYAKPLNLSQFEERICTVCSEVGKEILRNVIEAESCWKCKCSSGGIQQVFKALELDGKPSKNNFNNSFVDAKNMNKLSFLWNF